MLNAPKGSFFFSAYLSESSKHTETAANYNFGIFQYLRPDALYIWHNRPKTTLSDGPKDYWLCLFTLYLGTFHHMRDRPNWNCRQGRVKLALNPHHVLRFKKERKSHAHTWLGQGDLAGRRSDINDCGTTFFSVKETWELSYRFSSRGCDPASSRALLKRNREINISGGFKLLGSLL